MVSTISELTPEQRLKALQKATETRMIRATFKQEIRKGITAPADAVVRARNEEPLQKMKVKDIIQAIPHVGPVKTTKILETVGVSPKKTAYGLREPQLNRLIGYLAAL